MKTESPWARTAVLERLLPRQVDNRFEGKRAALWLLGLYTALKLAMSVNSIFNTESVAAGADGIPLASYGSAAAREIVTLFALVGLGQLALTAIAAITLIRYRGMVPLVFLLLLGEALGRRFIVLGNEPVRTATGSGALYINFALIGLLAVGLLLSLWPRRPSAAP